MADQIIDIPGVGQVAFPATMSQQEITTAAQRLYQQANPAEQKGLLGSAWEAAKSGGEALLEAAGRPGELVSGTLAGALAPQRDLTRGLRAFVEPLVGGTQHESMGQVIREQAPEFAKAHPYVTGVAGLTGDIVTDPLNLLGGAGIIRRGLIKGATTVGLGEDLAKTLTGVKLGEAFQTTAVPAMKQAALSVAAKTPLAKLVPNIELARVVKKGELSAGDMGRIAESRRQAISEAVKGRVASILDTYQITPEERNMLSAAIAKPASEEAKLIAAEPERLGAAKGEFEKLLDTIRSGDVQAGVMQAERRLAPQTGTTRVIGSELGKKLYSVLERLQPEEQKALTTLLREGPEQLKKFSPELQAKATKLANALEKQTTRKGTAFADLRTLAWEVDKATGELVPTVSTRMPQYVPQYSGAEPTVISRAIATGPRGELKAAEQRMRTFDEAVAAGSPQDIAELTIRRAQDSARARTSAELLNEWRRGYGQLTPAEGFRQLKPSTLENLPEQLKTAYTGTYLPQAVADEIERVSIRMRDPKYTEGLIGRGLKLWKTLATALNLPGHQLVNFTGNISNMYASGMRADEILRDYPLAMRALKSGKMPEAWKPIIEEARANGVIGEVTGLAGEMRAPDKLTETAQLLTGQKYNPLNPDAPYYQKLRDINQNLIEDPAKLALYYRSRMNGQSAEQAALTVKKYLFDYSELSDFEKQYMRNIFPFYTWTRKNIPLQLATLVENPTRISNQKRVLDMFNQIASADESGPPLDKTQLPEYMQSPEFFRLPMTTEQGEPVMAASRAPMFDLTMLTADPAKLASKVGFMLNPAVKIPVEVLTGRRLGSQVPIQSQSLVEPNALQRLTGIGVQQTPQGPKTTSEMRYWADQIPLPLGAVARTSAAGMDEKSNINPVTEAILRSVGYTPTPITSDVLKKAELARRKKVLAERKQRLISQGED